METTQLICSENGFYMRGTLVVKRLNMERLDWMKTWDALVFIVQTKANRKEQI